MSYHTSLVHLFNCCSSQSSYHPLPARYAIAKHVCIFCFGLHTLISGIETCTHTHAHTHTHTHAHTRTHTHTHACTHTQTHTNHLNRNWSIPSLWSPDSTRKCNHLHDTPTASPGLHLPLRLSRQRCWAAHWSGWTEHYTSPWWPIQCSGGEYPQSRHGQSTSCWHTFYQGRCLHLPPAGWNREFWWNQLWAVSWATSLW